jgi:isopropylmalate/homocitrate/citramalate synthase
MSYPAHVRVVEVGPRDGLQNEASTVPVSAKVALIDALTRAGLNTIEAGSFVSPKWVPQMADSASVLAGVDQNNHVRYPVLVPNVKGLEAAVAAGARDIAVFAAASETFSQRNINCSIQESFVRLRPVIETARRRGLDVRGYVSCVLGCPDEGDVPGSAVAGVAEELFRMGCYEVSLGDTIGVGTPTRAQRMIGDVARRVPVANIAVHYHDTYGQALANVLASLELGVAVVDSSVAGLGGCPYAAGATGNLATEDLVYMLNGMEIQTDIDLQKVAEAGWAISDTLGRKPQSKVSIALRTGRETVEQGGGER